jgi:hypothetical protein
MGLSEFHDTLLPVILYFGDDIGNGSLLLAIFLNFLKTFSGCSKRFRGIAMMENIRGQEKKIKSGLGGWKELKQKFFEKRERYKNIFNHETPPTPLAPDIHALQKSCIHTPYIHTDMHADIQTNRQIAIGTYISTHMCTKYRPPAWHKVRSEIFDNLQCCIRAK